MTSTDERKRILEMIASGKVSVTEGEQLLNALDQGQPKTTASPGGPRYLRVLVEGFERNYRTGETSPQKVNIRVPIQLLFAGVRLAGLIPAAAHRPINQALRENGIDLDVSQIKTADLEELVTHLSDMRVDVDQKDQKVQIFCE
ncbi:MAG: hypothetical protein C5B49_01560 [Bdellovibrio sp.]|nr:MAG: hypothetical protein C5B49_01560 [Bdellovibrio sp.]